MNKRAKNLTINEEESKCLIHSHTEIVYLVRSIMKHNALITAYFNAGREFILTSIVGIDPANNVLLLDLGPDEDLNKRLVESKQLLLTTTHQHVKVKFSGTAATRVIHEGHAAIRIGIPQQLVRMQRREYYRIATGIVNPLKCKIILPFDGGDDMAEITVLDISCGGLALIDQHHAIDLEPGNSYDECNLALSDVDVIAAGLKVCNTYEVTLRNGLTCKRSGCQFIDMQESDRSRVQRYITRLERDHNATGGR
ncbi:MAG: flagellar brake protein [Georgfuchsia sp.]